MAFSSRLYTHIHRTEQDSDHSSMALGAARPQTKAHAQSTKRHARAHSACIAYCTRAGSSKVRTPSTKRVWIEREGKTHRSSTVYHRRRLAEKPSLSRLKAQIQSKAQSRGPDSRERVGSGPRDYAKHSLVFCGNAKSLTTTHPPADYIRSLHLSVCGCAHVIEPSSTRSPQ